MKQSQPGNRPWLLFAKRGAAAAILAWSAWTVASPRPADAKGLPLDPATVKRGAGIYMQNCSSCHGLKGKGEGPVARSYNPPPTDFTRGEFRHGSEDDDLLKSITIGVPGTGMSGWKGKLSDADIAAVAAYIRSLRK